jgi:hypothetical protein
MASTIDLNEKCECLSGKTVLKKNLDRNCLSKHHTNYQKERQETIDQHDELPALNTFALGKNLRVNTRYKEKDLLTLIKQQKYFDPYTKQTINLPFDRKLYHIDHVHEIQVLVHVIDTVQMYQSHMINMSAVKLFRDIVNRTDNLVITQSFVNQSKGQAIKYFLRNYENTEELSLYSTLMCKADGNERRIAHFTTNILDTIKQATLSQSQSIWDIHKDGNYLTKAFLYESIAEQFDQVIDRMQLDSTKGVHLRRGKVYQAYHR